MIVPMRKGQGEEVRNYKRVSIMLTLYKMYTAEILREVMEGKGLIPLNQAGFRKGMGRLYNITVLNFLLNRQVKKKGRKIIALFVDLKTAFDSVRIGEYW